MAGLATSLDATVEAGGKLVTMRRSGYVPQADFQLEMAPPKQAPLRAWRFAAGADQADYVMIRYAPDDRLRDACPPQKGAVVVVVDTSAGGDESARGSAHRGGRGHPARALGRGPLRARRRSTSRRPSLYPEEGARPGRPTRASRRRSSGSSEHGGGGATDLGSMFEPALDRLHGSEQPAIVYVGDGTPTSGETSPDGCWTGCAARWPALARASSPSASGRDARHELLGELTRAGGGMYLRVDDAEQATDEALRLTSAIKTPTITDVDVVLDAALDQPFYSATGKLSRGEELVLLARTHHALPPKVTIKGRIARQGLRRASTRSTLESSVVDGARPAALGRRVRPAPARQRRDRGREPREGARARARVRADDARTRASSRSTASRRTRARASRGVSRRCGA